MSKIFSNSIKKASLYRRKHWLRDWLVLPCAILYVLAIYINIQFDLSSSRESTISSQDQPLESHWIFLISMLISASIHLFLYLLTFWSVGFCVLAHYTTVESIDSATHVYVIPQPHQGKRELCELEFSDAETPDEIHIDNKLDREVESKSTKSLKQRHKKSAKKDEIRTINRLSRVDRTAFHCFFYQKVKFLWIKEEEFKEAHFSELDFPTDLTPEEYLRYGGICSEDELLTSKHKWGDNSMKIPLPDFMDLFKEHARAPFFVFQVFSVLLWMIDDMWYYSVLTLGMLVMMEAVLVKQRLKNITDLREMEAKPRSIQVFRNQTWQKILTTELVPGDYLSLTFGSVGDSVCPCDVLLLDGSAVMNEASLTGESIPQLKEPISTRPEAQSVPLDVKRDKRHIIFSGTMIAQYDSAMGAIRTPDGGCLCYVLRTGFNTTQGKLVRTILFSTERATAGSDDASKFLLFLLLFSLVAAYYVIDRGISEGRDQWRLALVCAQIITSVVPPELPIELTLAVNQSLMKLSKIFVFCTEPFRIPWAGKVTTACFDKTGTLTSDEMVLTGLVMTHHEESDSFTMDSSLTSPKELPQSALASIAGCQSLACVGV